MPPKISRERAAFHQWLCDCLRASCQYLIRIELDETKGKTAFCVLVLDGIRASYGEQFWRRHGGRLRAEFFRTLKLSVAGQTTPSTTQQPAGARPRAKKEKP